MTPLSEPIWQFCVAKKPRLNLEPGLAFKRRRNLFVNQIANLLRRGIEVLRPDPSIRRSCYILHLGIGWTRRVHLVLGKLADDQTFVASGRTRAAHAKGHKPDRAVRLQTSRAGRQITVEIQFAQVRAVGLAKTSGTGVSARSGCSPMSGIAATVAARARKFAAASGVPSEVIT